MLRLQRARPARDGEQAVERPPPVAPPVERLRVRARARARARVWGFGLPNPNPNPNHPNPKPRREQHAREDGRVERERPLQPRRVVRGVRVVVRDEVAQEEAAG